VSGSAVGKLLTQNLQLRTLGLNYNP
jgi:hypothetical protein